MRSSSGWYQTHDLWWCTMLVREGNSRGTQDKGHKRANCKHIYGLHVTFAEELDCVDAGRVRRGTTCM